MPKRLLVVEDSKPIALVIEKMAVSLGYVVTIAPTFAVVKLLLAKEHDFFLATLDYGLPDAPNGEVVPFIIQHNIPSIIMTGRIDDTTHKKLLNQPIIDYITKENAQAYHYLLRILHGQLNNPKIGVLVVDSSLASRNHICQLLKRRNFTVYDVDDGTKAVLKLEEQSDIKIVITEQDLTGMSGLELLQKIRAKHPINELIIIALASSEKSFQSARFIKNGADDFLRKPFCPEEFYCRVMQNIEKLQYIEKLKDVN
jgi:DNA-binding response OmpR family regulator